MPPSPRAHSPPPPHHEHKHDEHPHPPAPHEPGHKHPHESPHPKPHDHPHPKPHPTPKFCDQPWQDLPPAAQRAAKFLGYDESMWDADEDSSYDKKSFKELSQKEKEAAMLLGMWPLDEKLDVWWKELDEETKAQAGVLGWDEKKWDDEWDIEDLPCEDKHWKELTSEERKAASYFGYTQPTWDCDGTVEFDGDTPASQPAATQVQTPSQTQTQNETETTEENELATFPWGFLSRFRDKLCAQGCFNR